MQNNVDLTFFLFLPVDVDSDIENREEVIPETCALFDRPHTVRVFS